MKISWMLKNHFDNNEALGLVHQQQSLFYKQGVLPLPIRGKITFEIAAGSGLETCGI